MDNDTNNRLLEMEKKIDEVHRSVEQIRLYFKWTLIISVVVIIVPLLASLVIIPIIYSTINSIIPTL